MPFYECSVQKQSARRARDTPSFLYDIDRKTLIYADIAVSDSNNKQAPL